MTWGTYRSDHQRLGQIKERYLNIIVNEPCPGLDVLCRKGHDFLRDIVPGFLRWLVWGLGGGHCRGMDQRCTRVDT